MHARALAAVDAALAARQFEDYRAVLHAIDAASAQLGDATRGRLGQPGFAID